MGRPGPPRAFRIEAVLTDHLENDLTELIARQARGLRLEGGLGRAAVHCRFLQGLGGRNLGDDGHCIPLCARTLSPAAHETGVVAAQHDVGSARSSARQINNRLKRKAARRSITSEEERAEQVG